MAKEDIFGGAFMRGGYLVVLVRDPSALPENDSKHII